MCAQSLSWVWLFATSWTVARQAPLSMEFFRQEYWSRLPFPTPGDLPDPGIESVSLVSPALAGRFLTTAPPGNTRLNKLVYIYFTGYHGAIKIMLLINLFKKFSLAYSCLKMLCLFLLYIKVNQLHTYSLFFGFPFQLVTREHWVEFPVLQSRFSLVVFLYIVSIV